MIYKKICLIFYCTLALVSCAQQPRSIDYTWEKFSIKGQRTGVKPVGVDNFQEALGSVDGDVYKAPNGKSYEGGCAPAVASIMLAAQTRMAHLREVIGHSEHGMSKHVPESSLSNWTADLMISEGRKIFGHRIDVGITNFGGIRVDFGAGDIILDDVRSMFPFHNYLCAVEITGARLQEILDDLASRRIAAVGGVRMTVENGKATCVSVGGKPINPKKYYWLATVDFLLDGGDGYFFATGARKVENSGWLLGEVVEAYVRARTKEGRSIDYAEDGRVVIK